LTKEEFVDVEYNMVELVDLAWGTKFYLGLFLNEEAMEGLMWMTTNADRQASSSP
jgi:hypothetical protein